MLSVNELDMDKFMNDKTHSLLNEKMTYTRFYFLFKAESKRID